MIEKTELNLFLRTDKLLLRLGFSPKLTGYYFLRDAICWSACRKRQELPTSKYLYNTLAEKYNTSPALVERAIRNAITMAQVKTNKKRILATILGYDVDPESFTLTNSEFIAIVANAILIEETKEGSL